MIIASLKVHEERPLEDEDKMSHIVSHSLKIGDICDAVYVHEPFLTCKIFVSCDK